MKNVICFLLAAMLAMPTVTFAQSSEEHFQVPEVPTYTLVMPPGHTTPPTDAFIVGLNENERAPFPGVLYSESANAWLQTEFDRINRQWQLEASTKIESLRAWCERELTNIQNEAIVTEQQLNLRISSLTNDNEDLQVLNQELSDQVGWSRREKVILVFTSIGVMVVSVVTGFVVGNIAH